MFKKHAIQLSVVKTPVATDETIEEHTPFMTKDEAHTIAKDMIQRVTIAVIAVMAAGAVLHTASEVVINACDRPDNQE